jgi:hypothetical protein
MGCLWNPVCGTQEHSIAPTTKPWQAVSGGERDENLQVIHTAVTSS